jgi:hypothetical protein
LREATSNGDEPIKYEIGDEVQVNIPDPEDPDHRYHRETGEIKEILEDDLSTITGDPLHDFKYTVDFDKEDYGEMDFRYDDLDPL